MNSEWSWQAAAISAPFTNAGRIGANHDQPSQATVLYVHRLDSGGTDRSGNLQRVTKQNVIYLQQKAVASSWHRYESTGNPVRDGDCWLIPVKTHAGSPVGSEPANNAQLLVTIPGLI